MARRWSPSGKRGGVVALTAIAALMLGQLLTVSWASADRTESTNITYGVGTGVLVTTSQGSTSNCTRDENYGSFTTTSNAEVKTLSMTVKNGGSCAFEVSKNSWKITFPNVRVTLSDGRQVMPQGEVWFGHDKGSGFYYQECYGAWVGYRCVYTSYYTHRTYNAAEIMPPDCNGSVSPGQFCSSITPDVGQPTPKVYANFATDNHNYLVFRNIGKIGCLALGPQDPRRKVFLEPGETMSHYYNGGNTWQFDAASDRYHPGRYGTRCMVAYQVLRS